MVLATVAKRQIAILGALFSPTAILAKAVGASATLGVWSVGVVLTLAHAIGVRASSGIFLNLNDSARLGHKDDRGRMAVGVAKNGGTHAKDRNNGSGGGLGSHCVSLSFLKTNITY